MSVIRRNVGRVVGVCLGLLLAGSVVAAQEVRVAAAYFPPYVFKTEQTQDTGLLFDLLEAFNQTQSEFRFVMVPTAIKRRFQDLQQQRIDLAIFENPEWGWQDIEHQALDMGLEDAEVFVTRAKPGRTQRYFDELQGKRLALYHGYHYAFAGFNSDPDYLKATFNATLTHSHESNLLMVLHQRADVALLTRSYINDFLQRNQQYAGQLLISKRTDQHYRHHALLRPNAPIEVQQLAEILDQVRDSGQLGKIFGRYQVALSPSVMDSSVAAGAAN